MEKATILSVKFSGDPIQEENFNNEVKAWSLETKKLLTLNVEKMATNGKRLSQIVRSNGTIEKKLYRSIAFNLNKRDNLIERVRFSFERHGVFLEKGVGKGSRVAKVWFNETIDNKLEELADIAQRYAVQFNIDKMSIKIK